MCGKAKSKITPSDIMDIVKNLEMMDESNLNEDKYCEDETLLDNYDCITPGKTMYVAFIDHNTDNLEIEEMRWGLNGYGGYSSGFVFNTKSESFLTKKTLSRFKNNRAIIVVNGFYEKYKKEGQTSDDEYFVTNKSNQFIIPVLYQKTEYGKKLFTILTKKASDKIDEIHDRQPLILKKKYIQFWLKYNKFKTDDVIKLLLNY